MRRKMVTGCRGLPHAGARDWAAYTLALCQSLHIFGNFEPKNCDFWATDCFLSMGLWVCALSELMLSQPVEAMR